jgi:hypothetical protein
MYQDPDIAAIIKNLDRKKQECVHGNQKEPSFKSFFILLNHQRKNSIKPENLNKQLKN